MNSYVRMLLGKYALLQYFISTQSDEYRQTQTDKQTFFARFARQHGIALPPHKKNQVHMGGFTEIEKLKSLTAGSSDNLFVAKTIFPFVLFTDTLKIDRQKVTIVHNDFFWQSKTASTEIKNIMNIEADMGPLFGSLTITSRSFLNNIQTIKSLKRGDVIKAQRLLQGFIIAQRAEINTDGIHKNQLLALLNDLGQENRK